MLFTLLIHSSPYASQGTLSALHFCRAALKRNHQIQRVFFYGDGVYNANYLNTLPQDEINLTQEWTRLAQEEQIELLICVAAAIKRGIMDQQEAKRYEKNDTNCAPAFQIAGLGQLIDACIDSDRVITFG